MDFERILTELLDTIEGSLGAILMGYDGLPIEAVNRSKILDLPFISAEIAPLLRKAQEVSSRLDRGGVKGLFVFLETANLSFWDIGGGCYLGLAVSPEVPRGQVGFKTHRFLPKLKAEI